MLYYKAVDPPTLDLLKRLFQLEVFRNMRLVGGTSLALQLGHRKSIDIDLFGSLEADVFAVSDAFKSFQRVTTIQKTENISIYSIEGIKVDIVNYTYPWLSDVKEEDGIRLAQMKDIAAMKLSAITGRGTKKDFVDISILLKHFSLKQMLEFYSQKYYDGSEFLVIKSLGYFEDAEQDPEPVMLHKFDWQGIKEQIIVALKGHL
ncbi:MAG: nucleotidyl transferase AbiEii/AbiGii toxin family protein [Bacteroidota bacterium]